jgi:amidohydrolase
MLAAARKIEDQLVAWRRDLHKHPELGFQETRTAGLVARELEAMGYRVRRQVGRTGVVAELGRGRPVVAIRADMDALPVQEENRASYGSQVPGVMHACGHDAHVACALGAARLLADRHRAAPPEGTVRLLFQPAEETEDDQGVSGAPRMIEDGALADVSAVIALHVDAKLPTGTVGLVAGPASAGVDTLRAAIIGQGGHGSRPEATIDPIYIACHAVLNLYGILARRVPASRAAVISVGSIHGGQAENVIPERVDLAATIRYRDTETQALIHREIGRALGIVEAMGGKCEYRIGIGCTPMVNHPEVIGLLGQVVTELLGPESIRPIEPMMGSEDFCFFSALAPGAMFMLGCEVEGDRREHHNPRFDIDERCLPVGAAILAEAALRLVHGEAPQGEERGATGAFAG